MQNSWSSFQHIENQLILVYKQLKNISICIYFYNIFEQKVLSSTKHNDAL